MVSLKNSNGGNPGGKLSGDFLSRTSGYHYSVQWAQLMWLIHFKPPSASSHLAS